MGGLIAAGFFGNCNPNLLCSTKRSKWEIAVVLTGSPCRNFPRRNEWAARRALASIGVAQVRLTDSRIPYTRDASSASALLD
jgi:hypothetical protein